MRTRFARFVALLVLSSLCASPALAAAGEPRAILEAAYKGYREAIDQRAYTEALPHAARAFEVGRTLYGVDHETTLMLELNLGDVELMLGHLESAQPLYLHALATLEKQKGLRDLSLLVPLNDLAEIEARSQRLGEATRYQQRALGVIEAAYGADHPAAAHRLIALGILAEGARDAGAARASYERALGIRRKLFASAHPDVAEGLYLLARLELRDENYPRAQELYREALKIWQKSPPLDRRALVAAQSQLAHTEQRIALETPAEIAAEPLFRGSPEYPESALRKKLEGWVRLSFTIDAKGQVKGAKVVEAEPARVFDRAALSALATWKYKPHLSGGKPVDQVGNEVVIRFVVPSDL